MAATGDRVPCVYVENRRVVGLDPADPISVSYGKPIGDWPTGRGEPGSAQDASEPRPRPDHRQRHQPDRLHDGRQGGALERRGHGGRLHGQGDRVHRAASRRAVLPVLRAARPARAARAASALRRRDGDGTARRRDRATRLVRRRSAARRSTGSSSRDNTLVLFTSDNGPVVDDGYRDEAVEKLGDHAPAGPFRGGKYSTFEGGTRVPFIVRWPARVKPAVSDALVSQVDLIASFAALVGPSAIRSARARQRERAAGAARHVDDRRAPLSSSRPASLVAQTGSWKYIEPEQGAEDSAEHEHRARQRSGAAALRSGGGPGRAEQPRRDAARKGSRAGRDAGGHPALRRAAASARRLNIVLAIADDWSFPHAGIYGDRTVSTPNCRSCRAGRGPVHARLRRGAVVHAVARGAADRSGRAPA